MLALDFDGVVCDALEECAAVSWYARPEQNASVPALPEAIEQIPAAYLTTFQSVRAYSRTIDDFMVANLVGLGEVVTRQRFDELRATHAATLLAQADAGEAVRAHWRETQPDVWTALHRLHGPMAELIATTPHTVCIVSAKDAESIWAILRTHGAADRVSAVSGSIRDKVTVLAALGETDAARTEGLHFVDDSLKHVQAALAAGVRTWWATWGYHTPEDLETAAAQHIPSITLDGLHQHALTGRN